VSSGTLNLYFVTARLSLRLSLRVTQYFRHSQKLQTSKHSQPHTIQILRAMHTILLWPQSAMPMAWPGRAAAGIISWPVQAAHQRGYWCKVVIGSHDSCMVTGGGLPRMYFPSCVPNKFVYFVHMSVFTWAAYNSVTGGVIISKFQHSYRLLKGWS